MVPRVSPFALFHALVSALGSRIGVADGQRTYHYCAVARVHWGRSLLSGVCVCWKGCTWALAENHNHDRSGKGAARQHTHTGWRTERTRTRRWPWWPRWGSRNRKTVHQPSRVHGWCTVRSKSLHLEAPRALKNAGRHRLPVGGGNVSKFVVT